MSAMLVGTVGLMGDRRGDRAVIERLVELDRWRRSWPEKSVAVGRLVGRAPRMPNLVGCLAVTARQFWVFWMN
jgi:hypothetical protein